MGTPSAALRRLQGPRGSAARRIAAAEGYNRGVAEHGILARDTSADTEERQVAIWRRMTPEQKLEQVGQLRETVLELSLAGIRLRHPGASERECFLRLMVLTLGEGLARAVYPGVAQLDLNGQ